VFAGLSFPMQVSSGYGTGGAARSVVYHPVNFHAQSSIVVVPSQCSLLFSDCALDSYEHCSALSPMITLDPFAPSVSEPSFVSPTSPGRRRDGPVPAGARLCSVLRGLMQTNRACAVSLLTLLLFADPSLACSTSPSAANVTVVREMPASSASSLAGGSTISR
jgi:hypothetical protein